MAARIGVPDILRPDVSAATPYVGPTAQRVAYPGIYDRPDVIAARAAANVAPENPALKKLFGVTRDDLFQMSQQGQRQGNVDPQIWQPNKPGRINEAAAAIMNPANAQRMIDTLAEARKYPDLYKGMVPWYVMDPMYQRMEQLVGPEQARAEYMKFNAIVPPFSAASDVVGELNRGTGANMFATQGNYPVFQRYGGFGKATRAATPDFPPGLEDIKAHIYHQTQADPVARYLATGSHGYDPNSVKIPLYMGASGVPQTGFQTRLPVPDAHFTRATGMPDVRTNKDFDTFMGGPEYRPVGPWYRENVAQPLGIESVPAQALMWGTYGKETGVKTKIGAPKLELLAGNIWNRAQKLGIDPYKLRDDVLTGKGHAVGLLPVAGAALAGLGALAPHPSQARSFGSLAPPSRDDYDELLRQARPVPPVIPGTGDYPAPPIGAIGIRG
jgi:hypothetical protein